MRGEMDSLHRELEQVKLEQKSTNQKIDDLRDSLTDQIDLLREDTWTTRSEVQKIKRRAKV